MSLDLTAFKTNVDGFTGQLLWDEPLAKYTYYKIGGPAALVCVPASVEDLKWLAQKLEVSRAPFMILGLASNVLISDHGFEGVIIRASKVDQSIDLLENSDGAPSTALRVGSGVAVTTLLGRAARQGWGGLEFLAGVPGSLGGVVTMNAGTSTGEAKDRLRSVTVFDLKTAQLKTYGISDLKFVYRENQTLTHSEFIISTEWNVVPENPAEIKSRIDQALTRRKNAQPVDYPSCGSVFRNPSKELSAWQVIEKLGLKGFRLGGAQFSEKHANFIINHGAARASEVHELIELAKSRAKLELGVTLREEVIRVGSF